MDRERHRQLVVRERGHKPLGKPKLDEGRGGRVVAAYESTRSRTFAGIVDKAVMASSENPAATSVTT